MYGSKMSHISKIWSTLSFFCGKTVYDIKEDGITASEHICGEKMELESVSNRIDYVCHKCGNSIPFYDVEKVVNKLAAMIVDEAINGCEVNLTNFTTKVIDKKTCGTRTYRVLEHKNGKMRISLDDGKKR